CVCQTTTGATHGRNDHLHYSRRIHPSDAFLAVNHALAHLSECINQTEVLASLLVKDAAVLAYRTDP
uniref:Uncharacterized protein n=1 Tax=Aegilops tauschii subsp. strangulata TaxID=200361 RepID=A0A453T1Q6_AEGTS